MVNSYIAVPGSQADCLETSNELGDQEGYENISVLQDLGQYARSLHFLFLYSNIWRILLPTLKELQPRIQVGNTNHGDGMLACGLER